jgi:hypothetical protein
MRMDPPVVAPATAMGSSEFVDASRSIPAWEPRCDLLDEPQIAVGIVKRTEGPVAGAFGVGAWLARLDGERRAVPNVTHVDAKFEKFVMGRLYFGDNESRLDPPRGARWEPQPERDRSRRARGRELDKAKPIHRRNVVVESPTQLMVKALSPIDVSHGDDVIFEPYWDAGDFCWTHYSLASFGLIVVREFEPCLCRRSTPRDLGR